MTRVLVVSNDLVQQSMAGPGIRCLELSRCLHDAGHDVTLAVPGPSDLDGVPFPIVPYVTGSLDALLRGQEVAVVQGWVLHHHPNLRAGDVRLVVDLYDPFHLENLVGQWHGHVEDRMFTNRHLVGVINEQLRAGDFFLCASERQRDLWLGALGALNRLNPMTYDADPTGRSLIDVVPFGLPVTPPHRDAPTMRGVMDGISDDDYILLWAGGLYDWFDPLTLIRAVGLAAPTVPRLRLVLHAGRHPNPAVSEMRIVAECRDLSQSMGLTGKHVFFNEHWVPYARRGDWLVEADAGVSTHVNHLETRYAFRTRLLDYLWAGLPILCTSGDTLGDLVEERRLGVAVVEQSPEALAEGIEKLAGRPFRTRCAAEVRKVAKEFRWDTVAAPLVRYCADPRPAADLAGSTRPRLQPVPLDGRPPSGFDELGARYRAARRRGGAIEVARAARRRVLALLERSLRGEPPGGSSRRD